MQKSEMEALPRADVTIDDNDSSTWIKDFKSPSYSNKLETFYSVGGGCWGDSWLKYMYF